MARGYIYYITTDKDKDVCFSEFSYYENLDAINADYVQDTVGESAGEPLRWLKDTVSGMGAKVGDMPGFAFSFQFDKVEQMLRDYFSPKLAKLKEEAAALDLFKVIRSGPALDYICNNQYSDAVELHDNESGSNGTFLSMDDFIRQVRSGAVYYVYGKLILMH